MDPKIRIYVSTNGGEPQLLGGAWVYNIEAQEIASTVQLIASMNRKFLLETAETGPSKFQEFSVVQELDSGVWNKAIPPHLYRIELPKPL